MNKTFLTVAQVLAIISGVFLCLSIIGIVFGVLNFVAASVMAAAKLGNASKDKVRNWSIYLIFTTWIIGGIFGLLASEGAQSNENLLNAPSSIEQQLKELDQLFDKGLISKEEYDSRRKKIIESV